MRQDDLYDLIKIKCLYAIRLHMYCFLASQKFNFVVGFLYLSREPWFNRNSIWFKQLLRIGLKSLETFITSFLLSGPRVHLTTLTLTRWHHISGIIPKLIILNPEGFTGFLDAVFSLDLEYSTCWVCIRHLFHPYSINIIRCYLTYLIVYWSCFEPKM